MKPSTVARRAAAIALEGKHELNAHIILMDGARCLKIGIPNRKGLQEDIQAWSKVEEVLELLGPHHCEPGSRPLRLRYRSKEDLSWIFSMAHAILLAEKL